MKTKICLLMLFCVTSCFYSYAQSWSQWIQLPNSANADVSISFFEVNTCKNFNYSYYRTNNNSLFAAGSYVFGEYSYHDCDGKVTTEHFYIYLDKKGVNQNKGDWYQSNGSGVFNVKIDNVSIVGKSDNSSDPTSSNSNAINPSAQTSSPPQQNNSVQQQNSYSTSQSAQYNATINQINANNARAQARSEQIQAVGNAVISAGEDIYNAIQQNKQQKEEYWNSLTSEQQQKIIEEKRIADSTKEADKEAKWQEESEAISHHPFSIGIYGAVESRDFNADDNSEFYNKDGFGKTPPVLLNINQHTGYNVGLNFEWYANGGLFSLGINYVSYSAPMVINKMDNEAIAFDGDVAMLKFQSIRVAPTLSYRLFRLGDANSLSGVFFQWGIKADYMFSATANPVKFDEDALTQGYSSITTKSNITDHFKNFEYGMIAGLRINLSRHFFLNVQYDLLGGLNDKVLKSKYSSDDEWYTFQEKHKMTGGIGISF